LSSELGALTRLVDMIVCDNAGLCGDIPTGVTPDAHSTHCPAGATFGTLLGLDCATSTPTESPSSPTSVSGEQPLKDNWFRKRDVAREQAFPQKYSWFRKQAKQEEVKNSTN